jgi:hypothetical protein
MRNFPGQQSLNWTQAVSQNQAFFRKLNIFPNMSQCHKQSSKLRSKNTSRKKFPQSDEMQTLRIYLSKAIRMKNHQFSIPSCHRQQPSGSPHPTHRCLDPGKCPFHVITHKMSSQERWQILSCKWLRWNYIQWQNIRITCYTATKIQLPQGLESPL